MFTAAVRRTAAPAARAIAGVGVGARQTTLRCMATGPASGGEISDELLSRLGSLSTQALVDGLWVMGWPSAQIDNARPLAPGMKCVGRAVTLNFVPARPDIAADKPPAGNSPEYEAFELCGPNEVSEDECGRFNMLRSHLWIHVQFAGWNLPGESFAGHMRRVYLLCIVWAGTSRPSGAKSFYLRRRDSAQLTYRMSGEI